MCVVGVKALGHAFGPGGASSSSAISSISYQLLSNHCRGKMGKIVAIFYTIDFSSHIAMMSPSPRIPYRERFSVILYSL
jgi:hypothetical protein